MGRVKWFNTSLGYGFVTVKNVGGENEEGIDIFVHHSNIECNNKKHSYLIEGEFVCFDYAESANARYPCQAVRVRGAPLPDGTHASLACDLFTKSPLYARHHREKEAGDAAESVPAPASVPETAPVASETAAPKNAKRRPGKAKPSSGDVPNEGDRGGEAWNTVTTKKGAKKAKATAAA